jgi:hypothetical protein
VVPTKSCSYRNDLGARHDRGTGQFDGGGEFIEGMHVSDLSTDPATASCLLAVIDKGGVVRDLG